ncbi:MAG: neutral/alkaline non-lysosomal ceramidase N-terminal domain-containing protein [Longimicrobiaceae bacterium]
MSRRGWLAGAALAAALAGCRAKELPLPAPESAPPAAHARFRAGFARVDITPPAGPSTIGYGPEAMRVRGWRGRLYARAMVLEDAAGERIALVQLDLGMASIYLHRQVAARTAGPSGIGADRLLLTATHTHSGPGHFLAVPAIDAFGGAAAGFDQGLADRLAEGIARAVNQAAGELQEARAAWSIEPVWGRTRIRDHAAFRLDSPAWRYRGRVPDDLPLREQGVDPDWRMLRVDVRGARGRWVPRGAFAVFAIHGTGITAQNDLFDPDIQGLVSARMEVAIDSLAAEAEGGTFARSPGRHGVFVLANGAEGDVSPNVGAETRCPPPRIVRGRRHTGPRTPPQPDAWEPVPRRVLDACRAASKAATVETGAALVTHALAQYAALGGRMDREPSAAAPRIARAFAVLPLRVPGQRVDGLCAKPREGTGAVAGAEDGYTRLRGWKLLGFPGRGFGLPRDTLGNERGSGCHAPMHIALGRRRGRIQGWLVDGHGLPEAAQLSAVRIGGVLIGTVPGEPTTTAGARIRESMATAAGMVADSAVVLSVTNGYLHYVVTREEYRIPFYEGSSTEYGPGEAELFTRALTRLASTVRPPGGSPRAPVDPLSGWYWRKARLTADPDAGPAPEEVRRAVVARCWRDGAVVVRWVDVHPGRMVPGAGPVVRIDRHDAAGERFETWDDDPAVEVRAIGALAPRGYEWEVRFRPAVPGADAYHLTFPARPGIPALDAGWFRVGEDAGCPHLR